MSYIITVCHPDKKEIEEFPRPLNANEALAFFERYPWQKKLDLMESMDFNKVHYSPSVRFTHSSGRSLEMTAELNDGSHGFSLWFDRPVMVKVFFGLMGEKETNQVIDKWGFTPAEAKTHLETFLSEKYDELEKTMQL